MTRTHQSGVPTRQVNRVIMCLALLGFCASTADAAHIRVGRLWDEYSNAGNEAWGGTCMVWPGGFWKEDLGGEKYSHSSASYRGFLYGVTNFTVPPDNASWEMPSDQPPGYVYPFFVVQRDIRNTPQANSYQLINGTIKLIYKSNPTAITTDGVANNPPEVSGGEDPTLCADAKIISSWRNNMGLETVRTAYAFAHPLHNDYHVWHYTFKNTGKYCCSSRTTAAGNPNAQYSQTLTDFYFSHSMWYNDRSEGQNATNSCCEWSGNSLTDYKGHNAGTYAAEAVTSDVKQFIANAYGISAIVGGAATVKSYGDLRIMYNWDGDSPVWPGEDSGDPDPITGRWLSPRWPGMALVHADVSVTNRADDPDQPKRFNFDSITRMPRIDVEGMQATYESMLPNGNLVGSTARFERDAVHKGIPYGAGANPKYIGSNTVFSVGGWNIPPGDSINTIWISAVGGFPHDQTVLFGKRMRLSDAELAAQGLTRMDETERLRTYYTGEDSLYTIVRRAQDIITRNVSQIGDLEARLATIPTTPPNPATLAVTGGIQSVKLTWTAPSTRAGEVTAYRIYRARGSRVGDFPFEKIYEGPTSVTTYTDNNVSVGILYYYYLVTVNASGVESSFHMCRTARGVGPSTAPVSVVADTGVYVVPNPYDMRYQRSTFASAKNQPLPGFAQQMLFYGLPQQATITIFTLDGVRVRTITHNANAGTEAWDLLSDAGQPVVSGVYIYVVDSVNGKSVGKLVIAR